MEEEVTQGAMLEELRKALNVPEVVDDSDAFTKSELARLWQLADSTVGRKVNEALESELVEEVYVIRERKDGSRQRVKAYRVKHDGD